MEINSNGRFEWQKGDWNLVEDEYLIHVIHRQINDCLSNEFFYVGVFVSTRQKLDSIFTVCQNYLAEELKQGRLKDRAFKIVKNVHRFEILFENKSKISFNILMETRGYRFHRILVGDNIDKKTVDIVLSRLIRPVKYESETAFDREALSWVYI